VAAGAGRAQGPKDWKLIGQPVKRLDTADKLNGKQVFGADLRLPGMLNAAIKACPVFTGKLASFDAEQVQAMPGVRAVLAVGDNAVAVVADTWWQAKTALDALPVSWDKGPHATLSSADIDAMLDEGLTSDEQVFVGNANGDAKQGLAGAAKTIEAVYAYPYQNHATMEPMNATALWTPERCEVWCPTQNGEAALEATAEAAGLPIGQCDVHKIHLGGGFGRRGAFHDFVTQAVGIAKQLPGTPVKLLWTREEDMAHGHYHPITKCRLVGGLTEDGELTALHVRISGQSILAAVRPQWMSDGRRGPGHLPGLPCRRRPRHQLLGADLLVEHAMRNPPVPPGFWRGVNINQNAIYLECFIDELAHAAGQDPLAFRRKLMADNPKGLAVLRRRSPTRPAGASLGRTASIAVSRWSRPSAAMWPPVPRCRWIRARSGCIESSPPPIPATRSTRSRSRPRWRAPSSTASRRCSTANARWSNGAVVQSNFHDYPSMLLRDMPKVEVIVMPSGGFWGGIGEPTIAVAAPAVLNAIFAATGERVRRVPIKHAGK
jgi:isoquinoline 1-oxidoreductase beta subunit